MKIIPYNREHREDILKIWERSVYETHNFLSLGDFKEIKSQVYGIIIKAI